MLHSWLIALQGGYYVLTGVWPLVHMSSFVQVTGPKQDYWLVRMVGALAVAIGLALLAALRSPFQASTAVLAIGSALAFLAIDVVYVKKKVIGPIYLGDAAAELLLIVGWVLALLRTGVGGS
jgi:hypothetical protein